MYSSPAVAGRDIWGKLVPYNEVWRTGANSATEISFSTDVMVAGQAVKAGKYALHHSYCRQMDGDFKLQCRSVGFYQLQKELTLFALK